MNVRPIVSSSTDLKTLHLRGDIVGLEGKNPFDLDTIFIGAFRSGESFVRIPYGTQFDFNVALDRLAPEVLVVDTGHFDDLGDLVDQLKNVRARSLQPVIMLCSRGFSRHDLSLERSAICDVSIRLPITSDTKASALLQQARRNNRELSRRRAMTSALEYGSA